MRHLHGSPWELTARTSQTRHEPATGPLRSTRHDPHRARLRLGGAPAVAGATERPAPALVGGGGHDVRRRYLHRRVRHALRVERLHLSLLVHRGRAARRRADGAGDGLSASAAPDGQHPHRGAGSDDHGGGALRLSLTARISRRRSPFGSRATCSSGTGCDCSARSSTPTR